MSAERPAPPALAMVTVADDRDVEPLLGRAAADLSALRLRHGVVTHRADAASTLADRSPEDEATARRHELEQERDEHRRRLEAEVAHARAEAAAVTEAARDEAIEIVRAATVELGAPDPVVDVALPPVEDTVPVALERSEPWFRRNVVHLDAVRLAAVAIVLTLLVAWVR
jgi:hypothetical protein